MGYRTFIPKRFFSKCKISKRTSKWINSELVEVDESLEFEGAVFNLNRQDIRMLADQGIQVTLDSKKIYCYIGIGLKNTIEFEGNNYIVTTAKNYMKHDELRIYYIERVQEWKTKY